MPTNPQSVRDEARFMRLRDVTRVYGLSHSAIYRLASQGLIRLVKLGPKSTAADVASIDRYFASLPLADVRLAMAA